MADHQYLSIGEVLGLLLEDFPDVTISKIRFLESQGLIEPERTPSGYRKFYDGDVELLRAILHEQKANFLPLKVIRDRIESGAIEGDITGGRTPPRGIRNVEQPERLDMPQREADTRDSVFRRTDGGPEWAGGQALIPGEAGAGQPGISSSCEGSNAPITTAVPVVPGDPPQTRTTAGAATTPRPTTTVRAAEEPGPGPNSDRHAEQPPAAGGVGAIAGSSSEPSSGPARAPGASAGPETETRHKAAAGPASPSSPAPKLDPKRPDHSPAAAPSPVAKPPSTPREGAGETRELPYNREELCEAAGITAGQLAGLEDYGIITPRGSGVDTSFPAEAVEIARLAGLLLGQGIDARHLRAWRQAAERESALFEQRIMPLLRQRNPQARHTALNSLAELSALGARLHDALVNSMLRHHFDGS